MFGYTKKIIELENKVNALKQTVEVSKSCHNVLAARYEDIIENMDKFTAEYNGMIDALNILLPKLGYRLLRRNNEIKVESIKKKRKAKNR